jgi:hypothetical protein
VTDHEAIQMEIPAYVASRLEAEELRRLQEHLAVCDTCREMASIFKEIAVALREGGEAMFDPHPGTLALRDFAQGKTAADADRIALHVAACPSCDLEVQAWRSRSETMPGMLSRAKPARRQGYGRTALAAAAGLLAGLGIAFWLLRQAPAPVAPTSVPVAEPPRETVWSGPALQLILPRALRGPSSGVTYKVGKNQRYVVVAFPAAPRAGLAGTDIYRFVVSRHDGTVTWSSSLTVAEMREHLEATEVITFVVPAAALLPGTYEFRAVAPGHGEQASYSVTVEISAAE